MGFRWLRAVHNSGDFGSPRASPQPGPADPLPSPRTPREGRSAASHGDRASRSADGSRSGGPMRARGAGVLASAHRPAAVRSTRNRFAQNRQQLVLLGLIIEGHKGQERQIASRVVVAVEQRQPLRPVRRVVRRVQIDRDLPRAPATGGHAPSNRSCSGLARPPSPSSVAVNNTRRTAFAAVSTAHSRRPWRISRDVT